MTQELDIRTKDAVRIMIDTCGTGRPYLVGQIQLTVAGYTTTEIYDAIRLWRRWKRESKAAAEGSR